jgi:hypothetical protein
MQVEITPTLSLLLTDDSVVFTDSSNMPFIESVAIPLDMWEKINLYINEKSKATNSREKDGK